MFIVDKFWLYGTTIITSKELVVQTTSAKASQKPVLPPIPPLITPTLIDSFVISGEKVCEIYDAHSQKDRAISTKILAARGSLINADMGLVAAEYFIRHRRGIPKYLEPFTIVFPLSDYDGFVRTVDYKGVPWWCTVLHPKEKDWDRDCCLIKLVPLAMYVSP